MFRSAFNLRRDLVRPVIHCEDESLADQSQEAEANINTIVKRFGLTGALPPDVRTPQYGDFSDVVNYQTALDVVIAAREQFMKLPAELRFRFGNDPQSYMDFCTETVDGKLVNLEEMRKLGIAKKAADPPVVPVHKVEVVNPPKS